MKDKFILDITCGGRTIWFNKNHPNAIYTDIRKKPKGFDKHRPNFEVCPDAIMDYRYLKYPDDSVNLIVWDPPHLKSLSPKSWLYKYYGCLNAETWQEDIKQGFTQCMRVLKPKGVLILKWSRSKDARSIQLKEMLNILPIKPLFGHTTGSKSQTNWLCFMKIP